MVSVGVVGATGLVGETMIEVLQDRSFPVGSFHPFASGRSEGKTVRCPGGEYPVEIITPERISKGMFLFGATSSAVAREWVPMARKAGAVVVDNSSAYRMDPDVPLVVPEVNAEAIRGTETLIANPNCSTIQLVVALGPLQGLGRLEWVSVATYQAVSGAGSSAVHELEMQQAGNAPASSSFRIHGNVITSIGEPDDDGLCMEERKLMLETRKILGTDIPVYASTARVAVRTGHTEAVTAVFRHPVDIGRARELLSGAPGLVMAEHGTGPVDVEGRDEVFVDRLRKCPDDPRALQFWVLADNLRKGAALNAVQIAEEYLKRA